MDHEENASILATQLWIRRAAAKDPKVKEAANKNSHMTLAKVTLDPKNDSNGKSASKSLLDSFKDMKG